MKDANKNIKGYYKKVECTENQKNGESLYRQMLKLLQGTNIIYDPNGEVLGCVSQEVKPIPMKDNSELLQALKKAIELMEVAIEPLFMSDDDSHPHYFK